MFNIFKKTKKKFVLCKTNMKAVDDEYGNPVIVYQIRARVDILVNGRRIHASEFGGYVRCEENLSHEGNCWISEGSIVASPDALITGDACVEGDVTIIHGSRISGEAHINNAIISNSIISGEVLITNSDVDQCVLSDQVQVLDNSKLFGATIGGQSVLTNTVITEGRNTTISGLSHITNVNFTGSRAFERIDIHDTHISNTSVSHQPVIIKGLYRDIVATDNHIQIGCEQRSYVSWNKWLTSDEVISFERDAPYIQALMPVIKGIIVSHDNFRYIKKAFRGRFKMPRISGMKRAPELTADDIVGVQPMTAPVGTVFSLNFSFDTDDTSLSG